LPVPRGRKPLRPERYWKARREKMSEYAEVVVGDYGTVYIAACR